MNIITLLLSIITIILIIVFIINTIFKWLEYKKIEKIIKRYNLELDRKLKRSDVNGRGLRD